MLRLNCSNINNLKKINGGFRRYVQCCPPRLPPGQCPCPPGAMPGPGRPISPPSGCRPQRIPPNPCVPPPHHNHDWRKYRAITLFVCFPVIILQAFIVFSQPKHAKGECRDFEYMRRINKRYPWRDGDKKTFFYNEEVNYMPGECEPPLLDCD